MTPTSVHDLRNLALMGHAGAGKTTLLEALLVVAGEIGVAGSVERGTTLSDFDPQEKELGHSLATAIAHLEWAGHWINILDTPGLPDLAGRALLALPAVETAAVVISAGAGIESGTRRMMQAAADKCRMIVVNKVDMAGVDFDALMASITASFGRECQRVVPIADVTRAHVRVPRSSVGFAAGERLGETFLHLVGCGFVAGRRKHELALTGTYRLQADFEAVHFGHWNNRRDHRPAAGG